MDRSISKRHWLLVLSLCVAPLLMAPSPGPAGGREAPGLVPTASPEIDTDWQDPDSVPDADGVACAGAELDGGSNYAWNMAAGPVAVPDLADGVVGHGRISITITDAPAESRVTHVILLCRTVHPRLSDLVVKLTSDEGSEELLWDRRGGPNDGGFDDDSESDDDIFIDQRTLSAFAGEPTNQGWHLDVWDHVAGETASIDYMEIRVYYAAAGASESWLTGMTVRSGGWTSQDRYPRHVADVNGDGKDDLVGYGNKQVYVALSTGTGFASPKAWLTGLGVAAGWASQNLTPRFVADVDGDGRGDLVAFGSTGVQVARSTGKAFQAPKLWIASYGSQAGGWSDQNTLPRLLGDVNGDGLADIVACGRTYVYVSLSQGTSFAAPVAWLRGCTTGAGGWTTQERYPRAGADVNGDGLVDLVGFGHRATYVALSTGSRFGTLTPWVNAYGYAAGGWSGQNTVPRLLADLDGDGDQDILGFGDSSVQVSYSLGNRFTEPSQWLRAFCRSAGSWTSQDLYPRCVGDVNGDGRLDIVGYGSKSVYVSLSN